MNKLDKNRIANIVVAEDFNRLLKQERERCVLLPMTELRLSPLDEEQMLEVALHAAVMAKISVTARLN